MSEENKKPKPRRRKLTKARRDAMDYMVNEAEVWLEIRHVGYENKEDALWLFLESKGIDGREQLIGMDVIDLFKFLLEFFAKGDNADEIVEIINAYFKASKKGTGCVGARESGIV